MRKHYDTVFNHTIVSPLRSPCLHRGDLQGMNKGCAVKEAAVCRSPVSFVAEDGRCAVNEAGDLQEEGPLRHLNAALENRSIGP